MDNKIKKLLADCHLDHIAIAVENIEISKRVYELIGFTFVHEEIVEEQSVKTAFAYIDENSKVELLEPLNGQGPIAKYIDKKGQGLHHICFRVKNITEKQKFLEEQGMIFLYPEARVGAGNCLVNFIHPKSTGGVLIELSQKKDSLR